MLSREEGFRGIGEGKIGSGKSSGKSEALRLMRDHVAYVGDSVRQYRDNGLLREIWYRRNTGTESIFDKVATEASDIITPLPVIDLCSPFSRRITRSQGPVELEFKKRKK